MTTCPLLPACATLDTLNPFNIPYGQLLAGFRRMTEQILKRYHSEFDSVVVQAECEFLKDMLDPSTSIGQFYVQNPAQKQKPFLNIRSALRG